MIHFVLAKSNSFTINDYKKRRGIPVADRLNVILYENISSLINSDSTTLIFSDFDRLTQEQMKIVGDIQDRIRNNHPELPVLNDVRKVKLRYQLLRDCYEKGINPYNVYQLDENWDEISYPVFLRQDNEHIGPISPLIYSPKSLEQHIISLRLLGFQKNSLIITEFCDVSNENGIYNKYSAAKVGDYIFPRYYDYSRDWIVKTNMEDISVDWGIGEYRHFFYSNPYEDWIRGMFDFARIDYGRIDFGLKNGKPVLWEINLNPSFGSGPIDPTKHHPHVSELRMKFHKRFHEILRKIDSRETVRLKFHLPHEYEKKLKDSVLKDTWRHLHMHLRAKRQPYKSIINLIKSSALWMAKTWLYFQSQ